MLAVEIAAFRYQSDYGGGNIKKCKTRLLFDTCPVRELLVGVFDFFARHIICILMF